MKILNNPLINKLKEYSRSTTMTPSNKPFPSLILSHLKLENYENKIEKNIDFAYF